MRQGDHPNYSRRTWRVRRAARRLGCGSALLLAFDLTLSAQNSGPNPGLPVTGLASWYGEELRGKPMANGGKFNPDNLTAASWYYPLGTRVRVTLRSPCLGARGSLPPSVMVTITDRGPAKRLVRQGRIIDLGHEAFKRLAPPDLGLVQVTVHPPPRSAG